MSSASGILNYLGNQGDRRNVVSKPIHVVRFLRALCHFSASSRRRWPSRRYPFRLSASRIHHFSLRCSTAKSRIATPYMLRTYVIHWTLVVLVMHSPVSPYHSHKSLSMLRPTPPSTYPPRTVSLLARPAPPVLASPSWPGGLSRAGTLARRFRASLTDQQTRESPRSWVSNVPTIASNLQTGSVGWAPTPIQ